MNNFMYLFRGGDDHFSQMSPEEQGAHMLLWEKWMGDLAQKGLLSGGERLFDEGKVVKNRGEIIIDGPFAEGSEIVGGYVIVSANSMEEAIEMSKSCPIFDYKGAFVEVRKVASKEN